MTSPQHPTTMEDLPDEVVLEILMRLLAKQGFQMRSVCKSWNALLSHSSFAKSHLHHSVQNNDGTLLLFCDGCDFDRSPFKAGPTRSPDLEPTNSIKLPVDSEYNDCYGYGTLIGSVNGLICFSYVKFNDDVVYIWNPSLSLVLTLPPFFSYRDSVHIFFQFGFDPKTDDYKVVKVTSFLGVNNMLPEVEVYSMRKGSWELIAQSFPSHITWIRDPNKVCTEGHDGHVHWVGFTDLELKLATIVAFDLGEEKFSEMLFPHSILHHQGYRGLGFLAGKLCVMSRVVRDGDQWEVWVMEEYGVAESWVKHHAFSQFSCEFPYGFTLHNEYIFEVDGRLCLYDPMAAHTKTSVIQGAQLDKGGILIRKVVEYVESLVWVAPAEHQLSKGRISS